MGALLSSHFRVMKLWHELPHSVTFFVFGLLCCKYICDIYLSMLGFNGLCKFNNESAKLGALRAHVPTCLACLRAHVPYVLTCSRVHVLTYLTCLCAHPPMCFACLGAHVPCVLSSYNKNKFSITTFPYIFIIVLCLFPVK